MDKRGPLQVLLPGEAEVRLPFLGMCCWSQEKSEAKEGFVGCQNCL